jgi:uncharacterized membrane protein
MDDPDLWYREALRRKQERQIRWMIIVSSAPWIFAIACITLLAIIAAKM